MPRGARTVRGWAVETGAVGVVVVVMGRILLGPAAARLPYSREVQARPKTTPPSFGTPLPRMRRVYVLPRSILDSISS